MKSIAAIFKNKEVLNRIVFTIVILLVFRIGAAVTGPGVTAGKGLQDALSGNSALSMLNLLGGGGLQNFSIFALGVSPYITSQIIVQLLSMDVLPALSELRKQGEAGRKKSEMATRYLTLMLGAIQAYGIIKMFQAQPDSVTLADDSFWGIAYIVLVMVAGSMLCMWLGDQITKKGIGNGISMIIFAGIVSGLPNQIIGAFNTWVTTSQGKPVTSGDGMIAGVFKFVLYIICFVLIIAFVAYMEMAKRKIPVQSAGRSGGNNPKMAKASFLPIKLNSAGVIPVIFASSIMMTPTIIASFVSEDAASASWLGIFDSATLYQMPGPNGSTWGMPWGLIIYIVLIILFSFFYSQMQINPSQLAENFQKNGSYIPGVRPGTETERYIKKVVNRVTFVGSLSLAFIAALPVVLTMTVFQANSSLAFGGTGLIIAVGCATELKSQVSGLIAGKAYDSDLEGR